MGNFSGEKPESALHNGEEKESKKLRRVFIEVGSGNFPAALKTDKKEEDNNFYLAIDVDKEMVGEAKKRSDRIFGKDQRRGFVAADAEELPLAAESVDEFLFANVFGDPRIQIRKKAHFFTEVARTLREGGRMILFETYTPFTFEGIINKERTSRSYIGPLNPRLLKQFILSQGFFLERLATPEDNDWLNLLREYGRGGTISSSDTYVLFLRKNKKDVA